MKLDGVHHITLITADARRNVDFYRNLLGLRFLKKTVNHDMPTVYHLYYGDDAAVPGSLLTYFEFPDTGPGRAGAGMIHTIAWRVPSTASLDYWGDKLETAGVKVERGDTLVFEDPDGMRFELIVDESSDEPLVATSPNVDPQHALRGFAGAKAYTSDTKRSGSFLTQILGFEQDGDTFSTAGEDRSAFYSYEEASEAGIEGSGTVHHIAWGSEVDEHQAWRDEIASVHPGVTPIIDRMYFRSIYFREPSGVLFEVATKGPGFTYDEPLETLGEKLVLPQRYEHLREDLVQRLTPIDDLLV